jgi:cbb3-type cytochrome oxidase subunit 3
MFERLFAGSNLLDWPIASMIFFFGFFLAVVLRVYSKRRRNLYEQMAQLPFDDTDPNLVAQRSKQENQITETQA